MKGDTVDLSHLIRVEVIGVFPIVSVTGYRDEVEHQFDGDGRPMFDADGNPVVTVVSVPTTEDISKPGFAMLDPAVTNIRALVKAQLVKVLPPTKKPATPQVPA